MKKLLFAINSLQYMDMHWVERLDSDLTETFEIHICSSNIGSYTKKSNFTLHELKLSRYSISIIDNLKTFFSAWQQLKKIKPDLIHSVTVKPNVVFGLLSLLYKKKVILTLPGLGMVFSKNDIRSKCVRSLLLAFYKIISLNPRAIFVFENRNDLNVFKKIGICNIDNSAVSPGAGVNLALFPRANLPSNASGYHVLFAARMLKSKGFFDAVAAIEYLKNDGLNVTLNVAGIQDCESPDAIPLEVIKELDSRKKINWLGHVDDMPDLIAKNHFTVLPTRYGEGVPRILIESAACGRPVITTRIGGCSEFVIDGKTGLLLSDLTTEDLAHSIKSLCDINTCKRMGDAGFELVKDNYTLKHVITVYKNLYEGIF